LVSIAVSKRDLPELFVQWTVTRDAIVSQWLSLDWKLIPRPEPGNGGNMSELISRPPALNERTLLLELNHRINNEFASAINLVSIAAVRSNHAEVKTTLSNVVELLHRYADVHRALKRPERDIVIDARKYLQGLCRLMSRSKLEAAGIRLTLAADPVGLHSERCWQLGMIVYELVTNAARHALFDGGDGEVVVELTRADGFANCRVSDNGSAPKGVRAGRGLKIIRDLARSLGGQLDHSFGVKGALFTLAFPFTAREERTNRRRRAAHPVGHERKVDLRHAQL
jgi:two-component sensor histidine kinase